MGQRDTWDTWDRWDSHQRTLDRMQKLGRFARNSLGRRSGIITDALPDRFSYKKEFCMRSRNLMQMFAVTSLLIMIAGIAAAQSPDYRVSSPYTYKNLSVFLLHGKDQNTKGNIMTLQEAMERQTVRRL